ncbi:hypothetical protein [Mucilaginibacter xinganensis]|uniref:3'-phosphoadenosine 5'-phosphosulfate sulfotransferase n=1 Tax=Mucilaginibacter xinganensis TaxID=1234841 RepID=A0A223NX25_9SPHI|nr:hypothetical protein [Mucilaginibacter xinganensis]ASU34376.1 3'-phosphoadenosine 5'-phosphosulfate sulfotransferase [Mucilaginibacter xinganensis]
MNEVVLDVASIGFGVQSSTILLLAANDIIERPDYSVFVDLKRESIEVYDYIEYFKPYLRERGIEVQTYSTVDILDHVLNYETNDRTSGIPLWFIAPSTGKVTGLNRQCTFDFKIASVEKTIRQRLGQRQLKRHSIRVWQGISTDELGRCKALYTGKFRINHYPLIDIYANITAPGNRWVNYSRFNCIEAFKKAGLKTPPKSSCIFCPFHDILYWIHLRDTQPAEFELCCQLDEAIRNYKDLEYGPFYLLKWCIPLRDADLDKLAYKKFGNDAKFDFEGCNSGFCFV